MDAEIDNEQPNSSSASSSNNSSSSNLLVNLPMLPMLHSQDDEDELEEQMPLDSSSAPIPVNQSHVQTRQPPISDNSVFISPLLFNNNSTPQSSSSSSTSSSSHNLHHHHNIDHSEHPHYQHSSPPLQQHAAPLLEQEHRNTIGDNATIEVAHTIDSNADVPSSSQQQQQQQLQSPSGFSEAAPHELQTLSTPLPLLVQGEVKQSANQASEFTLPQTPFGYPNRNINSINFLGYDGSKTHNLAMFSNNDNNCGANTSSGSNSHNQNQAIDRLKLLYPNVNENETPLPRCWSPHDKCLSIGLSQNNLRVHFKGVGKQHNDAASVRTAYPIPPACGLYYFEVKIISKGKNGYMGIGLTAQQFRMNRLPGWDKQSYGYHGDDGNSFSSSGNGQAYGPTFTTGDIIGCCVNFVNNTCFYTKNGIDLGIAFRDLPTKLYPTVGLQTPGEEVDANFGQEPFKFDQIEDMMKQMRVEMKTSIYDLPMPVDQGDPTTLMHRMVSSYLVHNGYSETAEAFAKAIGQTFREDMSSIRNRQKILKLIMGGKMGQAIEHTLRSYPGLLENNRNLWFMLKCRQFIEMVNGSDVEYCPITNKSTISITTQTTPPNQTSVIQSTKSYQNGDSTSTPVSAQNNTINSAVINTENHEHQEDVDNSPNLICNTSSHCDDAVNSKTNEPQIHTNIDYSNDVEMENNGPTTNGNSSIKTNTVNKFSNSFDVDEEMADIDMAPVSRSCGNGIERILEFGKELSQMGQQLEKENQMNDEDRQMLEDAFSLIAYSNPWSSPLGWQLCPTRRENVCTALNSAILESLNFPRRPPLDFCVAHASELLKVMAQASLGACAFVNIEDIFPQN